MPYRTPSRAQRALFLSLLTGALTSSALAQGRIVEAPDNIRVFSPENTLREVDATEINLRKVLEDLGDDVTLWYQHVQTLANPFFEGRSAGTRGFELTQEYVEFYFKKYGLHPAFPEEGSEADATDPESWTSHRQPFSYGNRRGRRTMELTSSFMEAGGRQLVHGRDFAVLGMSGGERVTAPLTFIGYGIEEGEDGYSSFEDDTDLTGRIAVVLRYEPLTTEGTSQWSEDGYSRHSWNSLKVRNIVRKGAAGIIMVNPPGLAQPEADLLTLNSSQSFGRPVEVPVVHVTPDVADGLLRRADEQRRTLATWRKLADGGMIKPVDLSDSVTITVEGLVQAKATEQSSLPSANVGGVLWGQGDLADEWIIIGGHMDHTGYSSSGALRPGADDNASGTSGVLILAKRITEAYANAPDDANLRSVLFMTFGAEEVGLVGSAHYTRNSTLGADDVTMMMNMDMIGRLRNHELMLGGTGTAEEFDILLPPIIHDSGLTIASSRVGRGPSDHSSFFGAGIPVLFAFTGMHAEYHQPGDHAYTVNPIGAIQVCDFVEDVVMMIAEREEGLTFQRDTSIRRTAPPVAPAAVSDVEEGNTRTGASVRFGIMPAYGANIATGVLVDDVSEGTSADQAGLQRGDVILTWNGEELPGAAELAEFLRSHKPGDVVKITLKRGNRTLTKDVKLLAN